MIYVALAISGLCFGSFVNAVVWRTRQQGSRVKSQESRKNKNSILDTRYSIFTGRSQCVHCGHKLAPADLIPVISWLALRGRCRYCKQPISLQYPMVELGLAAVFVLSFIFWFNPVELVSHSTGAGPIGGGQWLLFTTWLAASVGLLALLVYDLRFMLLPNKIIYPTLLVTLTGRLTYILFFSNDPAHSFWLLALSWLVASGVFGLIYLASNGRAIGFGDVRLGLITGTVLADPLQAVLMIFWASVLGTLFVLPSLVQNRKNFKSKVPYGPFLIAAAWLVLLFGPGFTNWYQRLLT